MVNNASLPLVCGWLGLVAKPWDAELFLFEIDILGGLSRSASLDHYALKMLSFSFIYSLGSVFLLPLWELPESCDIPRLYGVDLHNYQVQSHLLFVSSYSHTK